MGEDQRRQPDSLPSFASSTAEIRQAVEANAIRRGVFLINNLQALALDELLATITELAAYYDKEEWADHCAAWGINPEALRILDAATPPVAYPLFFCTPAMLRTTPRLLRYYRNVAMMSQKVMRGIQLPTESYELGLQPPADEITETLAQYLNQTISNIIIAKGRVTPNLHTEMLYANVGDSLGGVWRNEIGRLAYVEVLTPLIVHLHAQGYLAYLVYRTKGRIVHEDADADIPQKTDQRIEISPALSQELLLEQLAMLKAERVVYREVGLHNGYQLLLNRHVTWQRPDGERERIGPDMLAQSAEADHPWAGELKGGADPAGSDEHWKTATRAFDRVLLACERTNRAAPKLSFLATIIVERVAREAAERIHQGTLTSVYNLTQIAASERLKAQFLADITAFLGYPTRE